jgi:hypothetical protein
MNNLGDTLITLYFMDKSSKEELLMTKEQIRARNMRGLVFGLILFAYVYLG